MSFTFTGDERNVWTTDSMLQEAIECTFPGGTQNGAIDFGGGEPAGVPNCSRIDGKQWTNVRSYGNILV